MCLKAFLLRGHLVFVIIAVHLCKRLVTVITFPQVPASHHSHERDQNWNTLHFNLSDSSSGTEMQFTGSRRSKKDLLSPWYPRSISKKKRTQNFRNTVKYWSLTSSPQDRLHLNIWSQPGSTPDTDGTEFKTSDPWNRRQPQISRSFNIRYSVAPVELVTWDKNPQNMFWQGPSDSAFLSLAFCFFNGSLFCPRTSYISR